MTLWRTKADIYEMLQLNAGFLLDEPFSQRNILECFSYSAGVFVLYRRAISLATTFPFVSHHSPS